MIIAIDFDGTIVEHRYPAIGKELPFAIDTLKSLLALWIFIDIFGKYAMRKGVPYCFITSIKGTPYQ